MINKSLLGPTTDPYAIPIPRWEKRGRIFVRDHGPFFKSHATRPIPYVLDEHRLRIIFSSRCGNDSMHPAYIDVDIHQPSRLLMVGEEPLLKLGQPGTFDDSGITPGSILSHGGKTLMYYTGWKRRRLVSFELSIGVAELHDGPRMERLFQGPLIGQDRMHPILTGGPFVLRDGDRLRMWYCNGKAWGVQTQGPEPIYSVSHAASINGLDWHADCRVLLAERFPGEVITAPWVVRHAGGWLMWYSYRGSDSPTAKRYRIGVATSIDGSQWVRRDAEAGISPSIEGWDSEMVCYPSFYTCGGQTIMLYSGNDVGRSGIGWAVASEPFSADQESPA